VKTIPIQEAFERIEQSKSLILLYMKKDMKITPTMEQVCELVSQHNTVVPIVRVEIDTETLTKEEAQQLSIMRVPQLRFYANGTSLCALTGRISPSEVYEKILSLYTNG